ncbi:MAG: hypothetical protein ACO3EZ_19560 [Prochlorotrichaceae cyanobacterium]
MNTVLRSLSRSLYHKNPVSGMMLTAGVVNALIGGSSDRPGLFSFGLGVVGIALAIRWIRWQRSPLESSTTAPVYYLPERSSRTALPPLNRKSRN